MRCTVFGTGYLGATHAAGMAEIGHEVIGVDVDAGKVAKLGTAPDHMLRLLTSVPGQGSAVVTVLDPDTGPLARPYPAPLLAAHVPDTDPPKLAVAATFPSTAKPISPLAMSNHATRSAVLPASEAAGIAAVLVCPMAEKISCRIS